MNAFSSAPVSPKSSRFQDTGMEKVRETLRNGGYRTIA